MDYKIVPSIAGTYLTGSRRSALSKLLSPCEHSAEMSVSMTQTSKFKHFQAMVLFQKFSTRSSTEETSHNQQPATHCSNSSH